MISCMLFGATFFWPLGHKTVEEEFCTRTLKLSNQNALFIG